MVLLTHKLILFGGINLTTRFNVLTVAYLAHYTQKISLFLYSLQFFYYKKSLNIIKVTYRSNVFNNNYSNGKSLWKKEADATWKILYCRPKMKWNAFDLDILVGYWVCCFPWNETCFLIEKDKRNPRNYV